MLSFTCCSHVDAATNSAIAAVCGGKPATALSGLRNNSWREQQQMPLHKHQQQYDKRNPSSTFDATMETTFDLTGSAVKNSATTVRK
ncbi:hypothetical protein LB505_003789 [Fusarium chuoi]|nr:hypothetical protein LB505_003789 [Fusarium chuoi]